MQPSLTSSFSARKASALTVIRLTKWIMGKTLMPWAQLAL
jgi:hypothetical protein